MKKVFAILIFVLLFSLQIFAHPGRTDENGGHWNRKTGEYHFHSGEYAGKGSSGSSSDSEYVPFTEPYEPPTENPYLNSSDDEKTPWQKVTDILPVAIGAFIITAFSIAAVYILIYKPEAGCLSFSILVLALQFIGPLFAMNATVAGITAISTLVLFIVICALRHLYKKATDRLYLYEKTVIEYEHFLYGKELLSAKPEIPQEYEIGDDNMPKEKDAEGWGQSLTFYKSSTGKKLHQKYNCGNATIPVHIFQYRNYKNIEKMLCRNCSVQKVPQMRWYNDFLKYQKAQEAFIKLSEKAEDTYAEILNNRKKCNSVSFGFLLIFNKQKRILLNELNTRSDEIIKRRM